MNSNAKHTSDKRENPKPRFIKSALEKITDKRKEKEEESNVQYIEHHATTDWFSRQDEPMPVTAQMLHFAPQAHTNNPAADFAYPNQQRYYDNEQPGWSGAVTVVADEPGFELNKATLRMNTLHRMRRIQEITRKIRLVSNIINNDTEDEVENLNADETAFLADVEQMTDEGKKELYLQLEQEVLSI